MRSEGYKCYNSECKYYWGEVCRASSDVTLTCVGRVVHKKTNADHIRSMTDEELAEKFADLQLCASIKDLGDTGLAGEIKQSIKGEIEKTWLRWMKQPYKEEV